MVAIQGTKKVNKIGKKTSIRDESEIERRKHEKEEKIKTKKSKEITPSKKKLDESIRGIVRIADTDLDGTKKLSAALLKIRGIGHTLAMVIPRLINIPKDEILGKLSDEQVNKIEETIQNLQNHAPRFMINRRSDQETGKDFHISSSELVIKRKFDIDMMKKIKCYKGVRHEAGLPVRGQKTRSSFRTGLKVGVVKKKQEPAKKKE